jgi:hypothetical protein
MTDQPPTWVYAVVPAVPAGLLAETTGVVGEPVRSVPRGAVCAVVGSVGAREADPVALRRRLADPAWLEHAARSHHRVVARCAAAVPTVPFRLATVYHSDDRVVELLAARGAELAAALATVGRRAEWGVQAFTVRPEPAGGGPAAGADPDRPGTAYLLRRQAHQSVAEAARWSAAESAERVQAALRPLAAAVAQRPLTGRPPSGQDGPLVLDAAYLVDDHRRDEFTGAVRELPARHPALRLRLTGPWPAYSFVGLAEPAAA